MKKINSHDLATARLEESLHVGGPSAAEVLANKNADSMTAIMRETGTTFNENSLRWWKPTERTSGQITGVKGNLVLIATDYNLGLFLTAEGKPLLGHVGWFTGKVKALHSNAKKSGSNRKKAPSRSKRLPSQLDSI